MDFDDQVVELVGVGAAARPGDAFATVHGVALRVLLDEGFVARLLHPRADFVDGVIPGNVVPVVGTRPAHLRFQQTPLIENVLLQATSPWGRACRD